MDYGLFIAPSKEALTRTPPMTMRDAASIMAQDARRPSSFLGRQPGTETELWGRLSLARNALGSLSVRSASAVREDDYLLGALFRERAHAGHGGQADGCACCLPLHAIEHRHRKLAPCHSLPLPLLVDETGGKDYGRTERGEGTLAPRPLAKGNGFILESEHVYLGLSRFCKCVWLAKRGRPWI
jgi:hypothetical protein